MMRASESLGSCHAGSAATRLRAGFVSRGKLGGILAVSVALALLAGCGAARPSKYYQLTVPGDVNEGQAKDPAQVTLLLGALLTSHLYHDDRIVYSSGGEEMGTYEYQRWAEPPTEMIEEVLLRGLRASGHYRAVLTHRSSANGDFLLRGRLYDFKEVSGKPMVAKVTFEMDLRDLKTGATVWTHFYTHDEPVSGKDVPAVVAALNKNVQGGMREVVASLDQYFASHPVK
jgi:cholesterol transport system auxiliary component